MERSTKREWKRERERMKKKIYDKLIGVGKLNVSCHCLAWSIQWLDVEIAELTCAWAHAARIKKVFNVAQNLWLIHLFGAYYV